MEEEILLIEGDVLELCEATREAEERDFDRSL
jgi:ribosomal protein S28E/S33